MIKSIAVLEKIQCLLIALFQSMIVVGNILKKQIKLIEKKKFTSLNRNTNYNLCFLRHGQSTWNRDNVFIGWSDTPLTEDGVLEARVAGQMLVRSQIKFDEVHTSLLRRSIRTMNMVLMEMEQEYIPINKSWRLNERSYGQLVGQNKKEVVRQFGVDQVKQWRRSYDTPPPPHDASHPHWPGHDRRYQHMLEKIPGSESLKDTRKRSSVYWDQVLVPSLLKGKTLLIVGHENNLRSLIMNLEDISCDKIIHLNLPRGIPLAYRLGADLKPLARPDGKLDEATGMLRGVWLGGDQSVKQVLERDEKQVYDVSIKENLEVVSDKQKWRSWMEHAISTKTQESQ
jgi:2,3-bisphosphoglycerate-dependent phosphoglycerate mutase